MIIVNVLMLFALVCPAMAAQTKKVKTKAKASKTSPLNIDQPSTKAAPEPTPFSLNEQSSYYSPSAASSGTSPSAMASPTPESATSVSIEAGIQYPSVMGTMGQNFNQAVGFHAALGFARLLDDAIRNSIYVGYQNLPVKADTITSFRMIPILLQLGIEGKTPASGLNTTLDVGAGVTMGYLYVPNAASVHVLGYFTIQVQPGLEYSMGDNLDLVAHLPIHYLISSKSLSYLAYDLGLKVRF